MDYQNPFGNSFPEKILELSATLLSHLQLQDKAINYNTLLLIDEQLPNIADIESYLLHIVAFVGEVILQEHGGNWVMELAADNKT